jgi:sortase B
MKRNLKRNLLCGAAGFAALFLFSGVMLARQMTDRKQSAEAFAQVASLIREPETADPTQEAETEPTSEPAEEAVPVLTAFETYEAVYEQNPDFVGWLSIEGTAIDYPVMQSPGEPDFYLKHAFDKSYSAYGTPYVQADCMVGSSDNLILYSHHMKDGSMFAGLCDYESEDFYREHKIIRFDTLENFGEYEIVAVFKTVAYSAESFKYYHFINAESEEDFEDFITQCKELSLYDTGVSAEYGDKLITLSTCEYSRTNGRMVVVAKRIDPSPGEVESHAGY